MSSSVYISSYMSAELRGGGGGGGKMMYPKMYPTKRVRTNDLSSYHNYRKKIGCTYIN